MHIETDELRLLQQPEINDLSLRHLEFLKIAVDTDGITEQLTGELFRAAPSFELGFFLRAIAPIYIDLVVVIDASYTDGEILALRQ